MSAQHTSLSREYFENLYRTNADPWSFETSAYEDEKYTRSLAALRPSYARALEIGCSIGVFTSRLAPRCGDLLAIDISERAIERARARCKEMPNVHFARLAFPVEFEPDAFDLVTCCEVGYYWSDADLAAARDRIAATLVQGGDLLLVHYLPNVEEYVRDGDTVHELFLADERFERVAHERAEGYRLDCLRRR